MIRGLRIAIAGVLCASAAFGQATIRGYVTDANGGRPLQGVNVVLVPVEAERPPAGSTTDADGLYTVTGIPPGRYRISASYVGYEPHRDTIRLIGGDIRREDIALVPSQEQLGEVVVRAREAHGAANVTAGTQTVSSEELELIPTPDVSGDLASFLTNQPGVTTTGDRGGQVFIRGGEPTQNLTLLVLLCYLVEAEPVES